MSQRCNVFPPTQMMMMMMMMMIMIRGFGGFNPVLRCGN